MRLNQQIKDETLVLDYQSGNNQALQLLVRRWHKQFCAKAFFIVQDADEAKDVAQECWRTIIQKIETLDNPKSFGSWAMRIVYHEAIDTLRLKQKERRKKESYKIENELVEEPYDERTELKQSLVKAIKELPIEQQHVITLFYVNNYAVKEIAHLLNIKAGTVKSRLFHAREKLKTTLKHKNHEN